MGIIRSKKQLIKSLEEVKIIIKLSKLKEKLESFQLTEDIEVEIELGDLDFPISDVYYDETNNKIRIQYEF